MQLIIDGVSKQYRGGVWGLRDFNLTLGPGVLGLLGPNGAGKSTLMRILATITRASSGRVTWNGVDIAQSPDALRATLGYLPQDFGVYPNLSAIEFLEYLAAIKGLDGPSTRRRIGELLEVVNLAEAAKRPLGGYSGGMKQRVGIAQALLNDPGLLIVDEPTVGLDPEERVRFRNLLSDLSGERIVILSTHIVSDVEATATDIAIVNKGRLIHHAPPEELLQAVAGKVWELRVASADLPAVKQQYLVSGTLRRSAGVQVRVVSETRPAGEAQAAEPNLEDAYLYFVTGATQAAPAPGGSMKTARILYHMARADFLERVRRTSFLFAIALTIFLGYGVNTGVIAIELGNYRGIYNSAWVGSLMAVVINVFLSLAGFYLVKNAVQRDVETGVGQIMATTPLTRVQYMLGKWLSNFAVLAALVLVLAVAAIFMQLTQREAGELDLFALLMPMLAVSVPMMALTAALAVLFEAIGWLRGGFGNVVYFFVWTFGIVGWIVPVAAAGLVGFEPTGIGLFFHSMAAAAKAAYPAYNGTDLVIGGSISEGPLKTFVWSGLAWTVPTALTQYVWLLIALGFVMLAAALFTRFDPSREGGRRKRVAPLVAEPAVAEAPAAPLKTAAALSPVTLGGFRLGAVWLAELRLLLKGQRWWWYVVAAGLAVAGLLTPLGVARQYLLPVAWVWPVLIWSQLGNREAAHHTNQMVFSAPRAVWRQLPAAWLAGVTLAALTGVGVLLNLLRAGDGAGLAAWGAGALFIPALALAFGVFSGGSKLFEIIYLIIWYIGPMNSMPALDYTGATGHSNPAIFLAAAAVLLVAALLVRRWQVQGR